MPRYRSIEIPVMNYDFEADRYNIATGYEGRAWDRLQALETLESTGDTITFQDFTSGEQVSCVIEQISFERMSSPDRRYKGYGGVVYVQVRTL
jgi:ribosomal protein L21E